MTSPAIQSALDNLIAAIRAELRDEFLTLIGGEGTARQGAGTTPRKGAAKPLRTKARPKGARRSPEELEELTKNILAYVRKNAGQRAEQIAAGLGTSTKELVRPIAKLLADKALKTQGVRRGTTYTAR